MALINSERKTSIPARFSMNSKYSSLERLPNELLYKILQHAITPAPGKCWFDPHRIPGTSSTNTCQPSLKPSLLTSKTLYASAMVLTYRSPNIKINTPATSSPTSQFFSTIEQNHAARNLVRNLDLSQDDSKEIFFLSTNSLSYLPQIRSINISINQIHDTLLLQKLLLYTPQISSLAIDLSSPSENATPLLRQSFNVLIDTTISPLATLRITAKEASPTAFVPDEFFSTLLPSLPNLHVLDLSNTTITSEALSLLPKITRLTHLVLAGCTHLTPSILTEFLTTHPATGTLHTLVLANISYENRPLSEENINTFLASAPPTLRSLDLSNCRMDASSIPLLQTLHLEELSIGSGLTLSDIEILVLGGRYEYALSALISHAETQGDEKPETQIRYATVLAPMAAAVALCQFRQRLASVKPISPQIPTSFPKKNNNLKLKYLDFSSLPKAEQGRIKESVLLGPETEPLEVLEMRGMGWDDYLELPRICRSAGWRERWVGERVWVERCY